MLTGLTFLGDHGLITNGGFFPCVPGSCPMVDAVFLGHFPDEMLLFPGRCPMVNAVFLGCFPAEMFVGSGQLPDG